MRAENSGLVYAFVLIYNELNKGEGVHPNRPSTNGLMTPRGREVLRSFFILGASEAGGFIAVSFRQACVNEGSILAVFQSDIWASVNISKVVIGWSRSVFFCAGRRRRPDVGVGRAHPFR